MLALLLCASAALLALPHSAEAAVTRTGSITNYTSSSNSGSTNIIVPSDAELMVVVVGGFQNSANIFSGGSITIAGNQLSVGVDGDNSTAFHQGMIYYYDVRSLRGARTLAFDWSGAGAMTTGTNFYYAFYKGVDMTSSIRS